MGIEEGFGANPVVAGKYLRRDGEKFILAAARVPAITEPIDFNLKLGISRRMHELRMAGINAVIIGQRPAEAMAGIAGHAGLCALAEIVVSAAELSSAAGLRRALAGVVRTARALRGFRATAGYLLSYIAQNEAGEAGPEGVPARHLNALVTALRAVDPGRLIALRDARGGTPPPIAADLIFAPLAARNIAQMRDELFRMHAAAGPRPLVVEFAEPGPAAAELAARAVALGAAGVALPDAAPTDLAVVARRLAPFPYQSARAASGDACTPGAAPGVSIIIACAESGAAAGALATAGELAGPPHETLVAADPARMAALGERRDDVRPIAAAGRHYGAALNLAAAAARGEWLAFLDPECAVERDWLAMLMDEGAGRGLDGCVGPVFEATAGGACAAAAACNLIVRRGAFRAIGGFDPNFGRAGAAGDLLARLKAAGFRLGFHPGAAATRMVPRPVWARIRRQWEIGCAEARLERRHGIDAAHALRAAAPMGRIGLIERFNFDSLFDNLRERPLAHVSDLAIVAVEALTRSAAHGWIRLTTKAPPPLLPPPASRPLHPAAR